MCQPGNLSRHRSPCRSAGSLLRALLVSIFSVLAFAACDGNHGSDFPASAGLELTVLHINDHHSNLEAKRSTLQLANAQGQRVAVSVEAGGDVDVRQPKGQRASHFEVFHRNSRSWLPLDDVQRYRLFALTFNATGGDGYETLARVLPVLLPLGASFYSTKSFKY